MASEKPRMSLIGFTLIEAIVVVAILGLLILIKNSNSQQSFKTSHEALAKAFLLEISSRQASYWQQHMTYASHLSELGAVPSKSLESHYKVELEKLVNKSNQLGYLVKAVPLDDKNDKKTLWINHLGTTSSNWGY